MITAIPLNPSPRTRFQLSSDSISKHRKLLDLPELQRALDYAEMQVHAEWAQQVKDGNSAMMAGFKQQAVLEFIQAFKLLAEVPIRSNLVGSDNLAGNRAPAN